MRLKNNKWAMLPYMFIEHINYIRPEIFNVIKSMRGHYTVNRRKHTTHSSLLEKLRSYKFIIQCGSHYILTESLEIGRHIFAEGSNHIRTWSKQQCHRKHKIGIFPSTSKKVNFYPGKPNTKSKSYSPDQCLTIAVRLQSLHLPVPSAGAPPTCQVSQAPERSCVASLRK